MAGDQGVEFSARLSTSPPMVVLRPGDRVLVTLTEDPGVEECQHIASELKGAFPGVDFTVLTGVAGLLVAGGSESWPPDSEPPTVE